MILIIHTNNGPIKIQPSVNVKLKDIAQQLEEGNLLLIETIYHTTFIINCININAIEINTNIPPIQA